MPKSFTFTHAICRKPGNSITDGLRAIDTGVPDLDLFRTHHDDYVAALTSTGAKVTLLEPLEAFPDAVFIEDAALCLAEGAVIMRPGAPSRLGEAAAIAPVLTALYGNVAQISGPGFIEGGDILVTEREIFIGQSARTNSAGIAELAAITSRWGYSLCEVTTPPGVLHFKTDCSLLNEETILATKRLSATGCFDAYRVLHLPDGEEAAANAIRFNNLVLMPTGFPRTADMLDAEGFTICQIGNSEAAKLDGGMSCLSLRFSPQAT